MENVKIGRVYRHFKGNYKYKKTPQTTTKNPQTLLNKGEADDTRTTRIRSYYQEKPFYKTLIFNEI